MSVLRVFLLLFLEVLFTYAAERAQPICRQVFKLGSRGYAIVGVAHSGVVDIPAYFANVLFHCFCFI